MSVKVNLGSLQAWTDQAVWSLREDQPAQMKATLDAAAAEDRSTHDYQNRTGNAEASTQAQDLFQLGDTVTCQFGMGVDYAIYLDQRGLTRVSELAAQADSELQYYFDGERDRLALF